MLLPHRRSLPPPVTLTGRLTSWGWGQEEQLASEEDLDTRFDDIIEAEAAFTVCNEHIKSASALRYPQGRAYDGFDVRCTPRAVRTRACSLLACSLQFKPAP